MGLCAERGVAVRRTGAGCAPEARAMQEMLKDLGVERHTKKQIWAWIRARYDREKEGRSEAGFKALLRLNPSQSLGAAKPAELAPKLKSKPSAAFYQSEAWRRVRYIALQKSNGACVLCGRTQRHHGVILHVDHIKPRSKYPDLELSVKNLQVLCEDCNLGKGNKDDTDWTTDTKTDRLCDRIDWRSV